MSITIIFYIVFLSQIFLISYYYPRKFSNRVKYVVTKYPPSEYPKLYPKPYDYYAERISKKGMRVYKAMNLTVILIGLAILGAMLKFGYTPKLNGGDEVFVILYMVLQTIPHIFTEISSYKYLKRMREDNISTKRKAGLKPRRLFDFISPIYVAIAAALYVIWAFYFLIGVEAPWKKEVYITLIATSVINVFYILHTAVLLRGKKFDPHQAYEDQLRQIKAIINVYVFSSILISIFSIISIASDTYGWEVLDPVFISIFCQFVMIFSLGLMFRNLKIENINFDVYKADAWLV